MHALSAIFMEFWSVEEVWKLFKVSMNVKVNLALDGIVLMCKIRVCAWTHVAFLQTNAFSVAVSRPSLNWYFFFIWTGNVHIYTFWTHFTYDITRKVVQASPPPPFLFVSCLLVDPWTLGSFSGRCLVWEGCVGVYDDQNPTLPGQRSQGSRWNTLCTCMQADAGTFNTNETMFERNRGRKHEIKIRRFVGCL